MSQHLALLKESWSFTSMTANQLDNILQVGKYSPCVKVATLTVETSLQVIISYKVVQS